MIDKRTLATWLIGVGGVGMLVGAVDPLEGAFVILPASALLAAGVLLQGADKRVLLCRAAVVTLVAFGVAAMVALSHAGGVGGASGNSAWWSLLILPYPIGWSLGLWGPGAPRWLTAAGVAAGLWLLVLLGMTVQRGKYVEFGVALGVIGAATILGCVIALAARRGVGARQ